MLLENLDHASGTTQVVDGLAGPVASPPAAPKPPAEPSPSPAATPRPRGRPAKTPPAPNGGGLVLADEDEPKDVAGPPDPDDEDALGLAQPSLTDGEALEQALGGTREIYAQGHRGPMKEMQQR